MKEHYQLCAVRLGDDPDGPSVLILYDDCVNLKAARDLRSLVATRPGHDKRFLFIRRVSTSVKITRIAEGEKPSSAALTPRTQEQAS